MKFSSGVNTNVIFNGPSNVFVLSIFSCASITVTRACSDSDQGLLLDTWLRVFELVVCGERLIASC